MRGLVFFKMYFPLVIFCLCLICGCVGNQDQLCFTSGQSMDLYRALQDVWPRYAANSMSCCGARGLCKRDEACMVSFECLRRSGYELQWVYRLTGWFLLETRCLKNGDVRYFKVGRHSADGEVVCREFDIDDKFWIDVDEYACSLRFAPIVTDTTVGYTKMWDSLSDTVVCVPEGFHAIIQGGVGMFLLRKDVDGEYYRWNAANRAAPEKWKYYFPTGYNVRSSFFIAVSSETGKKYAFAIGLEPIPNSEGALAISPCGAYKGRQYYEIWKGNKLGRQYYAWPEKDSREPLTNGTETFGGGKVVVRDGRLVVLSPMGAVDVCQ